MSKFNEIFNLTKENYKNIFSILAISILLAIVSNYLSKKPLPLTPQPIEKISDDELLGDLNESVTPQNQTNPIENINSAIPAVVNQDSINKANKRIQDSLAKLKKEIELGKVEDKKVNDNIEKTVTFEQMKKIINNSNFVIIDARSADDYAKGKIGNALNIFPYDEESNYFPKILSLPRDKKIVIYCTGGNCDLSHHLAEDLMNFDFKNVFIYTGGWEEWELKNK